MPLSRLFATGLWLVVTAALTGMVWMATSAVAADVTDRPASVLAPDDVVDELESASSPATTTTSMVAEVVSPSSSVPPLASPPAPAEPDPPAAPTPPTPPPGDTTAPVSPPATETAAPEAPPEAGPARPPTTQRAPPPSATYSTSGGVVRVECDGILIDLVSAIPSNGYAVEVVAGGPFNVDVHFVGRDQDLSVKAVCFGQPIRYYDQSPPRPRQTSGPSEPAGAPAQSARG